jgi:UDP-N-acetylglucosamine:LPS N-acetylglucosamine transferase
LKRRVLQIIEDPSRGKMRSQALDVHQELATRGWELMIVLPNDATAAARELVHGGVGVFLLPLGRGRSSARPAVRLRKAVSLPVDWARLRALLLETSPCLVILGGLSNLRGALAARSAGVPIVWQLPDTTAPRVLRRAAPRLVSKLADAVLPPQAGADQYVGALERALFEARGEPVR